MAGSEETFQLTLEAVEAYESKFVPALFGEWAPHLADAAGVAPGHSVLDVACGTGVVAREVANRLGGDGRVVGVDVNEAMLTVARRLGPDIEWRAGDAATLPFADGSFDVVLCQAALMFFRDRAAALREMARVATAGGTVVFHVWASLDDQLAYRRLVDVAARHAGPDAVSLLSSYWVLGDLDELRLLCMEAGLEITEARTRVGTARFASIDELVRIEVEGTPLIERIDADVFRKILDDAGVALSEYRTDQGSAEVPIVGHIVTTRA